MAGTNLRSTPNPPESADLQLVDVSKRFGPAVAVDNLTLTVPAGSFFALLGPSGCGKTTTLRMVAGLEEPTAGRILLGSEDITNRKPYQRPVNTVFQNYALFPHLDVAENVAFGLRRRGIKQVKQQVGDMLALVELADFGPRKPAQLSGGQQQRVAVARALINHPQVLLLDEPLGALDLKLRRQMQIELKRIQTEVGLTFLHVTHDQEEAMTMADTIAVMNGGRIEQMGSPAQLYENPATVFVANFLGQSNLIPARVTGRSGNSLVLDAGGATVTMPRARCRVEADRFLIGVRPEKMHIVLADAADLPGASAVRRDVGGNVGSGGGGGGGDVSGQNALDGTITDSSFTGVSTQFLVRTASGQEVTVFASNLRTDDRLRPGAPVRLYWAPEHTFALDAGGDPAAGVERVEGSRRAESAGTSAGTSA